jgi:O-antigen ligase
MLFFIPLIYEITPGKSLAGDFIIRFNDTVNLENKTTNNRLNRWSYSAEVLKKNPFLGLGRFPVKTAHLEKGENINLKYFTDLERGAHNVFIGKLIHEGLLGLGIIIFFFWFIINKFKKINFTNKMYGSFLKIYLVSFILFSMFNTSYTNSEGRIFFFIILGFLNTEIFIDRLSKRKTELNDAIMFHQR